MTRPVLINNVDHKDLRVDTASHGAAFGDAVMLALTFPAEFRNVQACYPIVFHKNVDGVFQPFALFGFQDGQNLFLAPDDRWDANYVPLAIARQPFMIGRQDGGPVVHIDLDSPRVGAIRGESLFLDHGGTTEFLDRARSMLLSLHDGVSAIPAFIEALLRHSLLETFVLDIELDNGRQCRLAGFYTIHEERLRALAADAVAELHAAGHLEPIYMTLASLSRLRDLIDRMNRNDDATR
jgi:hypothetical protein